MTEENSEIKQNPELHSDRNGTLKYNKVRISNPWWKVIIQPQKKVDSENKTQFIFNSLDTKINT